VIHDTQGAGIGVNGGSNIVMTNNTLYRVGARSHVIEVVFGSRSCDGDRAKCTAFLAEGGWGTNVVGAEVAIPNKNVTIANNVVLNPDSYMSQWQQFTIATSRTTPAGSNVPTPARADEGLQIYGNIIWNGSASHPLGIEQPALATDVLARNQINKVRPVLVDPARGDYRVMPVDGLPPAPVRPQTPHPSPAPAPTTPLIASFRAVAAATSRSLTTIVVTFNRAVTGVTRDDFTLFRATRALSLNGARITTADNRTFTISGLRGTNLAGQYSLRLKAAGAGIADAWTTPFARPATVAWRMTRTVAAR
jgi:hypothetical protein